MRPRIFNHLSDPAKTFVRRRPSVDFSLTGLMYCAMMVFMGLAAVNSQANLLFGVFGLMIGILVVSVVISRLVLHKLLVHRLVPEHGMVGRPLTVTYEFKNEKKYWPSLSVSLSELDGVQGFVKQPQCYLLHAASRMTAAVAAEYLPKRRGLHQLNHYQIGTSFPFGFVKRARIRSHKDTVLIFPTVGKVDPRLLALCRSADNTGALMRPRPGGADEFYGVKEFRTGDNPKWIYWRRSARTGVLVSKEMTQVAPPKLLLIVDTFARDRSLQEHARIEKTIAMAASLASRALEDDMSVGLYAWGRQWVGIHPNRGKRQREELLSVLAQLPRNTAHPPRKLLDQANDFLKSGTTAVLLTPDDVPVGLSDPVRGSMLIVSAAAPVSQAWFGFSEGVDFTTCMPPDQQPIIDETVAGHGRG